MPQPGPLDELVSGGDPYECPACAAAGDACEFHTGWAEGWDACVAFVAEAVEAERSAELPGDLHDVEGVR